MSGSPLLLDLLARSHQEEQLERARRERLHSAAREAPEGRIPMASALRRALSSAGRVLAGLRAASAR